VDFASLYFLDFVTKAGTSLYQKNLADQKAHAQRVQAYRQASIHNSLAVNSHLNLNEQHLLELKKFGLDDFDLKKAIRREQAKNAAIAASAGGTFGKQGGSYQATIMNIARHGYGALARKDLNFKTKMRDFEIRHQNISLSTLSQNNAAFSNLSTGGSMLGTALSIAGTGVQTAINAKIGTTAKSGGTYERGF
jgi:hypothetical protein|tara:strand:+ start:48 stop:626 length:579 start_codon:yes stop_codon:yes gene_type:complete